MFRPNITTHRFRLLLGLAVLILIGYPYFDSTRAESGVFVFFVTVLFLVALHAVGDIRRLSWIGIALAVPALVGMWWPGGLNSRMRLAGFAFEAGLCLYVTAKIGATVFRDEEVTEDTLSGAICIYVFLGLAWTAIYALLEGHNPASFTFAAIPDPAHTILWDDLLYFSFTTLTTTGYGDITPATAQARSLTLLQHMVGVLYIAILMARLVAMYRGSQKRKAGP
jgi:hypothetical protein